MPSFALETKIVLTIMLSLWVNPQPSHQPKVAPQSSLVHGSVAAKDVAIEGTRVELYNLNSNPYSGIDAQTIRVFGPDVLVLPVQTTRADQKGLFQFKNVPAGRYQVSAWLEGEGRTRSKPFELRRGALLPAISLSLERGHALNLEIIDEKGRAIEGASALAQADERDTIPFDLIKSSPEGLCRFRDLSYGSYVLTIRCPGYAPVTRFVFIVDQREAYDLTVELQQGKLIHGRVLGFESEEGIAGVRVSAVDGNGLSSGSDLSGEKGAFSLPHVNTNGPVMLFAEHDNLHLVLAADCHVDEHALRTKRLTEDQLSADEIKQDLKVAPGSQVVGTVRDDKTRKPITNARVRLNPLSTPQDNRYFELFSIDSKTDDEGKFTLENVPPGPYLLRVDSSAYVPYANARPALVHYIHDLARRGQGARTGARADLNYLQMGCGLVESGIKPILESIELERAVSIDGFVCDQEGVPIEGARIFSIEADKEHAIARQMVAEKVQLIHTATLGQFPANPTSENAIESEMTGRYVSALIQTPARSGPDGKFKIRRLKQKTSYELAVEHPEFPGGGRATVSTNTEASQFTEIILDWEATLKGQVLGPKGPIENATISLFETRGDPLLFGMLARAGNSQVTTDAEGRFRLTHIFGGEYEVYLGLPIELDDDKHQVVGGNKKFLVLPSGQTQVIEFKVKTLD